MVSGGLSLGSQCVRGAAAACVRLLIIPSSPCAAFRRYRSLSGRVPAVEPCDGFSVSVAPAAAWLATGCPSLGAVDAWGAVVGGCISSWRWCGRQQQQWQLAAAAAAPAQCAVPVAAGGLQRPALWAAGVVRVAGAPPGARRRRRGAARGRGHGPRAAAACAAAAAAAGGGRGTSQGFLPLQVAVSSPWARRRLDWWHGGRAGGSPGRRCGRRRGGAGVAPRRGGGARARVGRCTAGAGAFPGRVVVVLVCVGVWRVVAS